MDSAKIERLRLLANKKFNEMNEMKEYDDYKVMIALDDSDVEQIVLLILNEAKEPISWREFKTIMKDLVGEDRLRRILSRLLAREKIKVLTRTRYVLA